MWETLKESQPFWDNPLFIIVNLVFKELILYELAFYLCIQYKASEYINLIISLDLKYPDQSG